MRVTYVVFPVRYTSAVTCYGGDGILDKVDEADDENFRCDRYVSHFGRYSHHDVYFVGERGRYPLMDIVDRGVI